jgi:glyoxylase-like metal-dependent hydrolase (beta-lactamase superfamily II)
MRVKSAPGSAASSLMLRREPAAGAGEDPTLGTQCVRVRTRRGWVVLASDAAHFYENMERTAPFPIVYSVADMVDGYRTMRALADSDRHVVPGHDPLVMARYPSP